MRKIRPSAGYSLIELLVVVAVMGVVAAIAVPSTTSAMRGTRLRSDAQAVYNLVALAKMRAASRFSRARVYADLAGNTYALQTWDKTTNSWTTEGAVNQMSSGVGFGFAGLTAAPPNTQVAIGFSAQCTNDLGANIANTACVMFNSRGIPIDNVGAPTGGNGLYVTDGSSVYSTTVTATPLIRFWWSKVSGGASWIKQ